MGADAGIDIIYPDIIIACILPADVLVDRIFLIRAGGIAVEGKERLAGIINRKTEVVQVLYHIGTAEVPGSTGINGYVNYVTRFYRFIF
ncbi:MAG: hypothetical protein MZV63_08015 [Marinilabiliales bacterium]|nr:hypothetical protein [Marinilabiliales bacterium]